ncbi:enoyl-CoA hydratase/isomerase family protein [Conexibacter sp. JD483]|uniref:enoyl-CoA hydratase/isomerase family protein n=1 Tax=unclassified Conexibacter TaxID=2627773 RepID=UPI002718DD0B|nr:MULTISPECIES: enoyl-CoA hydratase/isomerase family protein [unclassified Conexibacter]MDO8188017.1 enoyl-CoA hydratase/isomerase family protein [Conexibacter sp. CPCC 205706]MDO8200900.1 enoyl-CoA hydratase/isomerase family protein [Conexibacter sp. CPCC 205762]MDR9372732.1 enoyl-CoA hydratase/isomerase family protein [Conexibacter sp. JD483]
MPLVETEDRGAVRHLILNRPEKRNAMHGELVLALGAALKEAANAPEARVVVVRGAGAMFSSGMDFKALGAVAQQPEHLRAFRRECIDAWNLAEEMTKPVIAQIHGGCIGGALELALAADFRVVAADAVLGMPEVRVGLVPDVGGSTRLPALVGLGRAKELIMTGKLVGAEEAERIGLATRVAPADELDAATQQLADELLACAPIAVGLAKRILDGVAKPTLAASLELEVAAQQLCAQSDDFAEGAQALAEKRPPQFTGR